MKKSLVLSLVFILAVTLIACSSGGNKSNNEATDVPTGSSNTANDSENKSEEPKEPVTIKFYTYKAERDEEPYVQAVKAFNEQHSDIQVEYVSLVQNNDSVEFLNKLDILLGGGEQVDVFHTGNMEQLVERATRGVVEPLDDYFAAEGIRQEDEYTLNPIIENKSYGVMMGSTQWLVAFNRDHLEEANMPLPKMGWTWDDFREYAKKLTVNGRYGAFMGTWGEYANMIAYNELPHPQLKEDRTLNFDHPSFEYFFELRRAMEQVDKSVEPFADILAAKYHVLQQFFAGNASMIPVGSFIVGAGTLLDRFPHDFQMVYAPMPRSSGDAELGLTNISGSFLGAGKMSEHKEEAFTFMRWMSTEGAKYLREVPGWKKADGKALIAEFYGAHESLIDLESLTNTFFHPETKMRSAGINVPYGQELKTVVEEGLTYYMLNNSSFEEAKEKMNADAEKLMK